VASLLGLVERFILERAAFKGMGQAAALEEI
jgi:hypothetical protein